MQHVLDFASTQSVPLAVGCSVALREGFVAEHQTLAQRLIESLPWSQEVYLAWRSIGARATAHELSR